MFIEQAIDGGGKQVIDGLAKGSKGPTQIRQFLKDHESAKIIIIIDTHCLPSGGFVWKTGSNYETYGECSLLEVRYYWIYLSMYPYVVHRYSETVAPKRCLNACQMQAMHHVTTTRASSLILRVVLLYLKHVLEVSY